MRTLFGFLLVGSLLLGGATSMATAGEDSSRATHTVLVEFASWTW